MFGSPKKNTPTTENSPKKAIENNAVHEEQEMDRMLPSAEILETFQREEEKISGMQKQIDALTKEVSKHTKALKELKDVQREAPQKSSFLFVTLVVMLCAAVVYGGVWLYQQEDKMQALSQVGDTLVEQKNVISEKIEKVSTQISNAEIQQQIDDIHARENLVQQENAVLRDEIARLLEESEENTRVEKKSREFMIHQLKNHLLFLETGNDTAYNTQETDIPEEEKSEEKSEEQLAKEAAEEPVEETKERNRENKIENNREGVSLEEEDENINLVEGNDEKNEAENREGRETSLTSEKIPEIGQE